MIRYSAVLALLLHVLCSARPAAAQCAGVCGDVTGEGYVQLLADWVRLERYVITGEWTGTDLACADVDGFAGVNARDLQYMAPIFSFGGSLNCEPDTPAVPLPNNGYFLHYNCVVPPGDSSVTVYFDITIADRIRTLSIPMHIDIDGEEVTFGDLNSSMANGYGWEYFAFGDYRTTVAPPSVIMAGYTTVYVSSGVNPGRYPIGRAAILCAPSPFYRTLHAQQVENPPGDNAPMVIERPSGTSQELTAWAINPAPWVVELTGDTDNDRQINAADVIRLVGFVFKGGRAPYPVPAAGDVDCSGAVTSSDIIGLVNYIFKSGPAPCDVASLCTIELDAWTCP